MVLAACDSMGPDSVKPLLKFAEAKNETLERALFSHTSMDNPAAGATPAGQRFPAYFISPQVPTWDEATRGMWRLEIGGMVRTPLKLTLMDLASQSTVTLSANGGNLSLRPEKGRNLILNSGDGRAPLRQAIIE